MGRLLGIKSLSLHPVGGHAVWGVLIIAVAAAFSIWAYRTTLPAVRTRSRLVLTALRCTSFALLALILFQPVAAVVAPHSARPSVPILVDVSASMETPLGKDGGDTTRSRLDAARRVASFAADALEDRYRVPVYTFGLDVTGGDGGEVHSLPDTAASKYATAIGEALEEVALRREAESVVGLVLISDGAVNRGEDPARSLRSIAVPVYTVAVGEAHGVRDAQIFDLKTNPTAYVGSEVPVRAVVKSQGYEGETALLQLADGDEVVASKEIALAGAAFEQDVDLKFVPRYPGVRFYTLALETMEGEQTFVNNRRSLALEVLQEKKNVLYVEARPSWEFTFLKKTLDAARNLRVSYLVAMDGRTLRPLGDGPDGFPSDPDGLSGYSLVVVGDCEPSLLRKAQWSALADFVRRGGGAVIMAGRSRAGLNRFAGTPVAEVLPLGTVEGLSARESGAFQVSLTAVGREHPVTRVDVDAAVCDSLWANLPPLLEVFLTGHPRSRSEVLASVRAGGTAVPVLAVRNFGDGKVLAVNSSSLWRWGFLAEGLLGSRTLYDRLWANAVRWLTRGREEDVSVFAENRVYQSGETVRLGASVTGEGYRPITGASVTVRVKGADGNGVSRGLNLVDSDLPGRYEGKLESLPPGEYGIEGRAAYSGTQLGRSSAKFRVDEAGLEYMDLNARTDVMRAIAEESGGRSYTLDDFEAISKDVGRARLEFTRTVELNLWNHPATFILLLALLGAEWTWRRRLGMA